MKSEKLKQHSIRKKLTVNYGGLILLILVVFILFSSLMIFRFKTEGIDHLLYKSIEIMAGEIDDLIENSVKDRLLLENKRVIALVQELHELYEQEGLKMDEIEARLADFISSGRFGESGYSYALDDRGMMMAHPVTEYEGIDFSGESIVSRQMEIESGYLEYDWKNPRDDGLRAKMLYMDRLEKPDWIIATTAYVDDDYIKRIKFEDLRDKILNEQIQGLKCLAIMDRAGELILKTENGKDDCVPVESFCRSCMIELMELQSGKRVIPLEDPSGGKKREVVYFSVLPALNWILVGVGDPDELYAPVLNAFGIMVLAILVSFLLFILLNERISRQLLMPLYDMIHALEANRSEDQSARVKVADNDELGQLGQYFNSFMDFQNKYIKAINEARAEIEALAKFPDENPSPVIRINSENRIKYSNTKADEQILGPFGLARGDIIPEDILSLFLVSDTFSGRNELDLGERVFSFSVSRISEPRDIYLYGKDITKQKKYESVQLLSDNIFKHSIEGIVITDAEGRIDSVNPAFTQITGYREEEVLGKNPRILKSHNHGADYYRQMWGRLKKKGYWSGEIWNRRKNGEVYPELLTISSIRDSEGRITQYISFFHDLSDIKEKEERIQYEATHDKLTGLPNRESFLNEANSLIEKTGTEIEGFAIIYLDITNFKRINESIGTESGDDLLVSVAERLSNHFDGDNQVFRAGSDEFACLVELKEGQSEAGDWVDRILRDFKSSFFIGHQEINLEVSAGISVYPEDDRQPLELLSKAEAAMRVAKKDVNSSCQFYSPAFSGNGLSRLALESALKTALANRDFFLQYQPKVDALSGRIIGSEALVRLNPIEGEFIGPDIFIPVAEEIGLIEALGAWVLEKACRDTKQLIDEGYGDLQVAVNLSPRQFRKKEIIRQVGNIMTSAGIPPRNLNLEITESMAIHSVEESIRMMEEIEALGISLSIDDFGTGYSSLSYLSRFPVSTLKIDKAFVSGIPEEPRKTGVVLSILSLAENLGMKTVAEGVENAEQYSFLRERGCSMIQGYYFYKPLVFEDFRKALKENRT